MRILFCILIGYLLGALSPDALISKLKHKSLRENGTGNLGATNTMFVFGKKFGVIVMLFDIAKSFFAVWCVRRIVPETELLSLAAGVCAIIGHCFPFYLKWKGGKGLAAFAGLILAYDPRLFLFLLVCGTALMLIVNYSFILPFYAATVFSVFAAITSKNVPHTLLCAAASVIIMIMHASNVKKARNGTDQRIRDFLRKTQHKRIGKEKFRVRYFGIKIIYRKKYCGLRKKRLSLMIKDITITAFSF